MAVYDYKSSEKRENNNLIPFSGPLRGAADNSETNHTFYIRSITFIPMKQ